MSSWEDDRRKTEILLNRMKGILQSGISQCPSEKEKKVLRFSPKTSSKSRDIRIGEASKQSVFDAVNMKSKRKELHYDSVRKVSEHVLKISLTCSPESGEISVNVLDSDAGCRYGMNIKIGRSSTQKADDVDVTSILTELLGEIDDSRHSKRSWCGGD